MASAHLVEVARQIEGEHDLFAGAVRVGVDDAHHGPDAFIEGAGWSLRLEFVALYAVDPGFAERLGQRRRVLRPEADARLDDGADQRACLDARKPAGGRDAESRCRGAP